MRQTVVRVTMALGLTACGAASAAPTARPIEATVVSMSAGPPPPGAVSEFTTDFTRTSVPFTEILSGGPPKDGIPAIDDPTYVAVMEADSWLEPQEPVVRVQIGGDARAYPLQILIWHELVNDTVGGLPVVVSFCPLCNTAIVFERRVDGQATTFGTTGRLRYSNLIMYDRLTETWWQQATGEAIVGRHTGERLNPVPAAIIAWADFQAAHPDGRVLSRETGFSRDYGANPYPGYDDVNQPPFLYDGPPTPGQLPAMARVLTVALGDEAAAYPYDLLAASGVVNDVIAGTDIVVFWVAGTASALDAQTVAAGRDVGTATAFLREAKGQLLTFSANPAGIVDTETGSVWSGLGQAVAGPLVGAALDPLVAVNHFWFSWAAFRPDTRVYTSP